MCRFLPPPGRQPNRTGNLRYLVFFEMRQICEHHEKHKNVKYRMCRFLPPPGWQQIFFQNLRYLVFFEIRKIFEKDAKNQGKLDLFTDTEIIENTT